MRENYSSGNVDTKKTGVADDECVVLKDDRLGAFPGSLDVESLARVAAARFRKREAGNAQDSRRLLGDSVGAASQRDVCLSDSGTLKGDRLGDTKARPRTRACGHIDGGVSSSRIQRRLNIRLGTARGIHRLSLSNKRDAQQN